MRKCLSDHCHQGESDSISHTCFSIKKYDSFLYFSSALQFLSHFLKAHMWNIYFLMLYDNFPSRSVGLLSHFLKIMVTLLSQKCFKGCKWPYSILLAFLLSCCLLCNVSFRTQFAFISVTCFSKLFKLHSARI